MTFHYAAQSFVAHYYPVDGGFSLFHVEREITDFLSDFFSDLWLVYWVYPQSVGHHAGT